MISPAIERFESGEIIRPDYKYPRTRLEAFGTHTDLQIYIEVEPMTKTERLYCKAVGIAFLVLALYFFGAGLV